MTHVFALSLEVCFSRMQAAWYSWRKSIINQELIKNKGEGGAQVRSSVNFLRNQFIFFTTLFMNGKVGEGRFVGADGVVKYAL